MKIRAKYCPNCGSTNIKWINPLLWSLWHCYNCGYQGPVVLEDEELAREVRIEYEKRELEKS
jgi:DNA-directed RNA polymerase subunit M